MPEGREGMDEEVEQGGQVTLVGMPPSAHLENPLAIFLAPFLRPPPAARRPDMLRIFRYYLY